MLDALYAAPAVVWADAADEVAARVSAHDVVVALPDARAFAQALAARWGVPAFAAEVDARGEWRLPEIRGVRADARVTVASAYLTDAAEEFALAVALFRAGFTSVRVAAAVDVTTAGGRARLALQGVSVVALEQLAVTPAGLIFERRFPQDGQA